MRFVGNVITRVLVAGPGQDSQAGHISDLIDPLLNARSPWKHLGVINDDPIITIRNGLFVLAYESVVGEWDVLYKLGAHMQCSLALLMVQDDVAFINIGPASVDFMQVRVSENAGDSVFHGRVDFELLGDMRELVAT